MATIEELKNQAAEIRDADQEKENTALRVGQMLMAVLEHIGGFVTSEQQTAALERLSRGIEEGLAAYARLDESQTSLSWDQSPLVVLASMGAALDDVDGGTYGYSPRSGDLYYKEVSGYQIHEQQDSGSVGKPAHIGVLYVNAHTLRCYQWDGTAMVELGQNYSSRRVITDMAVSNLNTMAMDELGFVPATKKLAIRTGERSWHTMKPDPRAAYIDRQGLRTVVWDPSGETWLDVGGGGSLSEDDIVANLNSSSNAKALAASMGPVLKQAILTLYNSLSNSAFATGKPALSWGVPVTYRVRYGTMSHCTGGQATEVAENDPFTVTLTADAGYSFTASGATVRVLMGGVDVTSSCFEASTGVVTIAHVTGNVTIEATAAESSDHLVTYDLTGAVKTSGESQVADGEPLTVVLSRDDNAAIDGAGWGASGGLKNRFKATDVLVLMGGVPLNAGKDAGFTVSQGTDKGPITIQIARVTGQVDVVFVGIVYDRYLKGDDIPKKSSDSSSYTYPHIPIPPSCAAIRIYHNYINDSNGQWAAVIYDETKARTASVDLNGGPHGGAKTTSIDINLAETAPGGHRYLRTSFYDLNTTSYGGVASLDGCYIYDLTNRRFLWAGANAVEPEA